jgi:hypothetical protein
MLCNAKAHALCGTCDKGNSLLGWLVHIISVFRDAVGGWAHGESGQTNARWSGSVVIEMHEIA